MKNTRSIIFDMDGVLFDTESMSIPAWEKAGQKFGITGLGALSVECTGTNAVRCKEIITGHFDHPIPYEEIRQEKSRLMHESFRQNGMPVKAGVFELMHWLQENNYRIGLATSTSEASASAELAMCGLDRFLDTAVYGDNLKRSKPAPDIFLMCAERLQVVPADTWVIEDSYNGIRAAHAAGMRPIMVPDMLPPTEEMEKLAVQICQDLQEVQCYLKEKMVLQAESAALPRV